jgi:hypothetical protein
MIKSINPSLAVGLSSLDRANVRALSVVIPTLIDQRRHQLRIVNYVEQEREGELAK